MKRVGKEYWDRLREELWGDKRVEARKPSRKASWNDLTRNLRTNLLAGSLVLAPVAATILILVWVFTYIDNILQPLLKLIIGRTIPGAGFVIALLLVYLTGVMASKVGGRTLIHYGQSMLSRVPIVRPLYGTVKQVVESFSASGKNGFTQAVLVEFPRKGAASIGFVTGEMTGSSGKKLLSIYVPTSPNPTSGFLQIVGEDEVIRTNISVNEAMKMVISAGRVSPAEIAGDWPPKMSG